MTRVLMRWKNSSHNHLRDLSFFPNNILDRSIIKRNGFSSFIKHQPWVFGGKVMEGACPSKALLVSEILRCLYNPDIFFPLG